MNSTLIVLLIFGVSLCLGGSVMEQQQDDRTSTKGSRSIFTVEGTVYVPDYYTSTDQGRNWQSRTRILFNYEEYVAFIRKDGSFVAHVPKGSYIVEVANKDFIFEPVRVDVSAKGNIRARKLSGLDPKLVQARKHPLKFTAKLPAKYFQTRESWRITDFLMSPMVLMMVLPLVLLLVLPKLIDTSDPDLQKEMRESFQMPKYEVPELSEMMTSFFGSNKKTKQKAIKKKT